MATKVKLEQQTKLDREAIETGARRTGMSSKLSKMNMFGFNEEIRPPWVIMKDEKTGEAGWFNPVLGVYGSKIYKDIVVQGDIIICVTDFKQTKNGKTCNVEIFSITNGELNLAYGLKDATYRINENNGITAVYYKRKSSFRSTGLFNGLHETDLVVLKAKDESSGKAFNILICKYGNRVAIPYDKSTKIEYVAENIIVSSLTIGQRVKFNPTLDVLGKSSGAIVFSI